MSAARYVFGSTAAYFSVAVATNLTSVALLPLMTRVLGPDEYGVMLLVVQGSTIITFLFAFSFAQSLPALFHVMDNEGRRGLYTTVFVAISAVSLIPHVCIAMLSQRVSIILTGIPNYGAAIVWSTLWSYFNICSLTLVLIARFAEQHTVYLKVQMLTLPLLATLVVCFLVVWPMHLVGFYVAMAIVSGCTVVAYLIILRYWISGTFRLDLVGAACRIGAPTMPWQLATALTTSSGAFFLTSKGRLWEVGLFSLATSAAGVVLAISNSFENVWSPFVLARKNEPEITKAQARVFSLFSSGLLIIASTIGLFAHEVFVFLAGPLFREGYYFVPGLAFAYSILAFAHCFAQGLPASQRTEHYVWIGGLVIAVFLAGTLTLVDSFGAFGLIWSMIVAFLTQLVLLQLVSNRYMPVRYPWLRHLSMWLIAAAIVASLYELDLALFTIAVKLAALIAIVSMPFLFGIAAIADIRLAYALALQRNARSQWGTSSR
jgi:O-antigen/teichoic acid export membrane protein